MVNMLKKHAEKLRFAIVGGLNTAIDFGTLFILVALGLPALASNYISTSVALMFSFFANKSFTFKDGAKFTKTKFSYFLTITLFGLWIIQPVIIEGARIVLNSLQINSYVILFAGKIMATIVTLIWNYLLYRKFVFIKDKI